MNNSEDEWETDGEDYFRLKVDNLSKIKQQLNKIVKLKTRKYKKLEEFVELKEYFNYLNEQVYPNITVYNDQMTSLKLNNEDYHLITKPEVGTNLIFEMGKSSLTYIGTSNEYYEATTKIHRKINARVKIEKSQIKTKIRKKKKKEAKPEGETNNIVSNKKKEKKRKRRHKCKHKKNSTIYSVKKIDKS
jgi:hypothetical protein